MSADPPSFRTLRDEAIERLRGLLVHLEDSPAAPLTAGDIRLLEIDPEDPEPAILALTSMTREGVVREHRLVADPATAADALVRCVTESGEVLSIPDFPGALGEHERALPEQWIDQLFRDHAQGLILNGGIPSVWSGEALDSMMRRAEAGVVSYSDASLVLGRAEGEEGGGRDLARLQEWLDEQLASTALRATVGALTPGQVAMIGEPSPLELHQVDHGQAEPVMYCAVPLTSRFTGDDWYSLAGHHSLGAMLWVQTEGRAVERWAADFCLPLTKIPAREGSENDADAEARAAWITVRVDHPEIPVAIVMPREGTVLHAHIDGDGSALTLQAERTAVWAPEHVAQERFDAAYARWLVDVPEADPVDVRRVRFAAEADLRDLIAAQRDAAGDAPEGDDDRGGDRPGTDEGRSDV